MLDKSCPHENLHNLDQSLKVFKLKLTFVLPILSVGFVESFCFQLLKSAPLAKRRMTL